MDMAHSKIAGAVTKHTSEGTLYPSLHKKESERYIMITSLERYILSGKSSFLALVCYSYL